MDIRQFEKEKRRARTPIVILSGESSNEEKMACLNLYGADEYLVKPAPLGVLLQTLYRVVTDSAKRDGVRRVLIVDDEVIGAKFLKQVVEEVGAKCEIAGNIKEVKIKINILSGQGPNGRKC